MSLVPNKFVPPNAVWNLGGIVNPTGLLAAFGRIARAFALVLVPLGPPHGVHYANVNSD